MRLTPTHNHNGIRHPPGHVLAACTSTTNHQPQQVRIGKKWMEYHGANDWHGLLHPLDDTLRSELLRYGKFVQATYNSFDFDPSSSSYAACRFPKHSLLSLSGLPDTGYRVTRHLYASSGIQLPRWAEGAPAWVTNQTSWIGYVAVCDDREEIARLGRRDVVIAYRGTFTCLEWLENLRATLTLVPGAEPEEVKVERGFWSLYTSPGLSFRSLQEDIRDEVRWLLDTYGQCNAAPLSITVTGHSLGAALALLTAYDVTATFRRPPHVSVVSFGGPRVGNARFRCNVEEMGIKVLRVVNTRDIVTKVPGFVVDAADDVGGRLLPEWLSRAGWAYSDVGQELRVSCRSANMAACHDLNVYLQLVKQLSDTCPFKGRSGVLQQEGEGLLSWTFFLSTFLGFFLIFSF